MENDPKPLFARPVFRWLAGIAGLVCLAIGVALVFPALGLTDEPRNPLAAVFLGGASIFGSIAAIGRLRRASTNR